MPKQVIEMEQRALERKLKREQLEQKYNVNLKGNHCLGKEKESRRGKEARRGKKRRGKEEKDC